MDNEDLDSRDLLRLDAEKMRELGYRVVDTLIDQIETLPDQPVGRTASPAELAAKLREPLPDEGSDPLEVLQQVERDVLANIVRMDHPRFFGFVSGPSNFVGVIADALASGFNVFAGTWLEASGPTEIELVTIDWLRQACGLPESAGGVFTTGGSAANINALAVARHVLLDGDMEGAVVYSSDQTHSSIERGLGLLGFKPDQLHEIGSDDAFRFDVAALRQAVAADRAAGRRPFCVIATPGSTNTGAVDPLDDLAACCRDEGMWLHADGAYGAAAALSRRGRSLLAGIDKVDSLALDPHKWLFQPYEIGCIIVREESWLEQTFSLVPEYLEDATTGAGEFNLFERGIELTRSFRALKLWMSLKVFGAAEFERAIDRAFDLAELAGDLIEQMPDWELVAPPSMGIVAFRYAPAGTSVADADTINERLVGATLANGFAMVSSTKLDGRSALRMCCINPRTTASDVRQTLDLLDQLAGGTMET